MKFIRYGILSALALFAFAGIASSPVTDCAMQMGYGCTPRFESVVTGTTIDCSNQSGAACLPPPDFDAPHCNTDTGEGCDAQY